MEKVSINSDLELELLLLTDSGKRKVVKNESIISEDYIDPNTEYVKVRLIQNRDGTEFEAINIPDSQNYNCYTSNVTKDGIEIPTLVVTIPARTFTDDGFIWMAIETREPSDKFTDRYKNTESILEKTEVLYVNQ